MVIDKRNQHVIAYFLILAIGTSFFKLSYFEDSFLNRMIFYGILLILGIVMLIYHRKSLNKNVLVVQFSFVILMITFMLVTYL